MQEKITIKIDADLAGKLASKMDEAGFSKLTEYIEFILEQVVEEGDENSHGDEAEEKEVRERLRDMGYL